MPYNTHRYFIELQLDDPAVPRNREAALRRAQAAQFIDQIAAWLHDESLKDKVTSLAITALGQVQITCEQDIIDKMRDDDALHIASIRQSAAPAASGRLF